MERMKLQFEQNLSILIVRVVGSKLHLWFKKWIDRTG